MGEQVEGQLTLFPEDSPASRSPLPGSKEARRMTATSGQKWLGLSKNFGPLGLLEKMLHPTGKSMGLYAEKFMTHQYAQLHFCNKEAIDRMIDLLQRMKELWEREERGEDLLTQK